MAKRIEAPTAPLFTAEGDKKEELKLPEPIFSYKPKMSVLHQAIRTYLYNLRRGTHSTKNRSMVKGGGRKPWPQKHTGRARQGSIRAVQWVGGAVAHGPKPREYHLNLPRKMKRLALKMALTGKALDGEVYVIEDYPQIQKTKEAASLINRLFPEGGTVGVIFLPEERELAKYFRNLVGVEPINFENLNAYRVLKPKFILLSYKALERMTEVWG